MPEAPSSSRSFPLVKRSNPKDLINSCGSPVASVCAIVKPPAGMALNPPVPKPVFRYRLSIGQGPRIGEESRTISTMPAHWRMKRSRERLGNISRNRSEEHTSELQSLMRISYAVFCLKTKNNTLNTSTHQHQQHTSN